MLVAVTGCASQADAELADRAGDVPVQSSPSANSSQPREGSPVATKSAAAAPDAPVPVTSTSTSLPDALRKIGVRQDPIPFGATRKRQMAEYDLRHYGRRSVALTPKVIVLHYTAGDSYQSARGLFTSNAPAPGPSGTKPESPGTCTHFVIDKDGTTYQLVPLNIACRHAIGLNQVSVGIELVEPKDATNILARRAQTDAAVRLVKVLQNEYEIPDSDVIGHSMANDHRLFEDLQGWKNDHGDWTPEQVAAFRKYLTD